MAKQKKKEKKHKSTLSKHEKTKFDSLIILPYVIIIPLILNYEALNYFCARAFNKNTGYFYDLKSNSVMLCVYFLLMVLMISVTVFIDNAKSLSISLKEYCKLKNPKAKTQVKVMLVKCIAILLLCALSFCLGSQQKYIGEEKEVVSYSLFKQDKEYIPYEDVINISVEMANYPGIHVGKVHTLGQDVIEIILKTDYTQYRVGEDAFNGDYNKIKQFLRNFDESIISYDSQSKAVLR